MKRKAGTLIFLLHKIKGQDFNKKLQVYNGIPSTSQKVNQLHFRMKMLHMNKFLFE